MAVEFPWRNDAENAPKDGTPIVVIDNRWSNREWCRYSIRTVQWEPLGRFKDNDECGWVYDFDHEYGFARTVDDFEFWCAVQPPEEFQSFTQSEV